MPLGLLGEPRPQGWAYYGELATPHPLREPTWREFLAMKAGRSLATAGHPLDRVDTQGLASNLPEPARADFVRLDAFAGNMLTDGAGITAVLDIGYACVAGDRHFNPLASAVYLELRPQTVPIGTARDRQVAQAWLQFRRTPRPTRTGPALASCLLGLRRRRPSPPGVVPIRPPADRMKRLSRRNNSRKGGIFETGPRTRAPWHSNAGLHRLSAPHRRPGQLRGPGGRPAAVYVGL